MSLPSEDILPVAAAVARLAPSEVTANVLADVEPNASLLLHLPPPPETPTLPREGTLEMPKQEQTRQTRMLNPGQFQQ